MLYLGPRVRFARLPWSLPLRTIALLKARCRPPLTRACLSAAGCAQRHVRVDIRFDPVPARTIMGEHNTVLPAAHPVSARQL